MSFTPHTRKQKILYGENITPKTGDEYAIKYAVDNAGSGGSGGLPEVTTDDNGDVLTVVSGAWAKAAPPTVTVDSALSSESENPVQNKVILSALSSMVSDASIQYYNFTVNNSGDTYSASTSESFMSALSRAQNNFSTAIKGALGDDYVYLYLNMIHKEDDDYVLIFSNVFTIGTVIANIVIRWSNNSIAVEVTPLTIQQ